MKNKIAFLDFEASGLHPESYPISIGVSSDDFEYYSLIKPTDSLLSHGNWDVNAEFIHGLSLDKILEEGKTPTNIIKDLIEITKSEYDFYADSNYDLLWYNVLLENSCYSEAFNLNMINRLINDISKSKLIFKEINRVFMENNLNRHNALDDAVALKIAYKNIK